MLVARARGMSGANGKLAVVHRLRALRPHHVIVYRGVVTEVALRAIWVEAAGYASKPRFEIGLLKIGRLLDEAHKKKLLTWAGLHEMVGDIRQRGRAGTVLMRTLASDRPPGSSPVESRNEDRFEKILAEAGERPFRRQVVVGGHEPVGRSDHGDPKLPLVVEINSLIHHTTPSDRAADELRYRRLNDAGFTVGVIWEDDLWSHPRSVLETVREARRLTAGRRRTVIHSAACPWPDVLGTPLRG
jgi:very-short-patch-repair endonuclease